MGMQLAYTVGILAAVCAASAQAEDDLGPISELPETGFWAEYKMELERTRDGKVARRDATLTIASVGEETVSGKKAQWIAVTVRIDAAEQLRSIILLPVDSLRGEESPLTHAIRAFSQRGDEQPQEIQNPQKQARRGPLETLLPGRLTHVGALDEKRVKTARGREIVAKGRTGRVKLADRSGEDELLYRIWSSPEVPFGLAVAEVEELSTDRQADRKMKLVLKDFGTGAIPTSIEELDRLPTGLEVVHAPNPARATETGKSERAASIRGGLRRASPQRVPMCESSSSAHTFGTRASGCSQVSRGDRSRPRISPIGIPARVPLPRRGRPTPIQQIGAAPPN